MRKSGKQLKTRSDRLRERAEQMCPAAEIVLAKTQYNPAVRSLQIRPRPFGGRRAAVGIIPVGAT